MIELRGFTKRYPDLLAVDALSFRVEAGAIFGFIGPNGAGKTTTIRFLATLLPATAGSAEVNGFDVAARPWDVRRSIGFMPDAFGVYDGMRVWEFLDFFALAYGLDRPTRLRTVDDVLALVDLGPKRDALVSGLSRGMRQRLCLARTLVHDPPVLILDEPASGLDPRARVEFKEILRELQRMGKTILISSHILTELADLCSAIAIMEAGRLVVAGAMGEVLGRVSALRQASIRVLAGAERALAWLEGQPDLTDVALADGRIRFGFAGSDARMAELVATLQERGHQVAWVEEHRPSLETAFLSMTEGRVQ